MLVVEMIEDLGEGEAGAEQQESRWARPPIPVGVNVADSPLSKLTI